MPHITEELYQAYYKQHEKGKSIHISAWPKADKPDEEAEKIGELAVYAAVHARRAKTEKNLSLKEPLKRLVLAGKIAEKDFELVKDDIIAATRAEKLEYIKLKADSKIDFEHEIEV